MSCYSLWVPLALVIAEVVDRQVAGGRQLQPSPRPSLAVTAGVFIIPMAGGPSHLQEKEKVIYRSNNLFIYSNSYFYSSY